MATLTPAQVASEAHRIAAAIQLEVEQGTRNYLNLAHDILASLPEALDDGWCPYDCGNCHQDDCGCSNCGGEE